MGRDYRATEYPPDTEKFNQSNIDMFWNFIWERHQIWINRFIKKLPREQWTTDSILKVTKYTNIYRELDRGTLWYLENIMKSFCDSYDKMYPEPMIRNQNIELSRNLVWYTTLYRLCNRIETFEEVGLPDYDSYNDEVLHNKFFMKLDAIADSGRAVMTSAHLTCPSPAGFTKVEGYMAAVNDLHKHLKNGLTEEINSAKTPKEVFEILQSVYCVGRFISYEVLCDLIYCQAIGYEGRVFTLDDWANVGPGAKEGIRMMYPSTKGEKNIYARMVQLRDEQQQHMDRLGLRFQYYEKFTKGHLSLRTIEHDCCEFQKYWLQKRSLGKQRMIFNQDNNRVVEKEENGKQVKYKIIVDPDTGTSLKKIYLDS